MEDEAFLFLVRREQMGSPGRSRGLPRAGGEMSGETDRHKDTSLRGNGVGAVSLPLPGEEPSNRCVRAAGGVGMPAVPPVEGNRLDNLMLGGWPPSPPYLT